MLTSIRKLLEISADCRFSEKQQQLAIKLAEWHYKQGKKQTEKNEKIKCFTNAIHYIGKAFHMSHDHSEAIQHFASRLFKVSAIQLSVFQDRLELAINGVDKPQVLKLIENLETRFVHVCCENEKNSLIKLFFKQISAVYKNTFNLRGQERLVVCGLSAWYESMQNWLEKKMDANCFLTTTYRQELLAYRQDFRNHYENLLLQNPDSETVKAFQQKISAKFIAFLQHLLKDAFAILGDPLCHYDLRAMGSLAEKKSVPTLI